MFPKEDLSENSLLIVTGSTIQAEQQDRPLAYRLRSIIQERLGERHFDHTVVVLGDLWYLNSESLRRLPTISVGPPGVNAVSAHFYKRLTNALVVDNTLLIQMDLHLEDLRVSLWGNSTALTGTALEIFTKNGYLDRFLGAVTKQLRG